MRECEDQRRDIRNKLVSIQEEKQTRFFSVRSNLVCVKNLRRNG